MPFTFRPPTVADAEMLLDWRTRPEITRFMFTDLEQDVEGQCARASCRFQAISVCTVT